MKPNGMNSVGIRFIILTNKKVSEIVMKLMKLLRNINLGSNCSPCFFVNESRGVSWITHALFPDFSTHKNNSNKKTCDLSKTALISWSSFVACVQTSPISFHPRKRDVCETAPLIVFQYPAVFQELVESAFIGCLTIATVRNNSDWLSLGNARDNVSDLHLAGFPLIKTCPIVCCVSRLF